MPVNLRTKQVIILRGLTIGPIPKLSDSLYYLEPRQLHFLKALLVILNVQQG